MDVRSYQSSNDFETGVKFRPVAPRRSFEEILVQFEQAILSGRLRSGQKLPPERDLAEQFEVSRSSLREALRVLEALGVLSARRGSGGRSGSWVEANQNGLASLLPLYAKLREVPLADLVEMRVAIERMTAAGAARSGVEAAQALEPMAEEMRGTPADEAFLDADTRFHLEIARWSGNSVAPLLMGSIREAMAREMQAAFDRLTDRRRERDRLLAEHQAIVDLVHAGDASGAAAAMEQHIRGFYAYSLINQVEVT